MAAFREAIAAGADGIEFDVRLTNDGVPVIIHDEDLKRTSGLRYRIANLSWSKLEGLNVAVPRLEELFTLFKTNDLVLYLEIKCDLPDEREPLAKACLNLIDAYSLKKRVFVESFDLPVLEIVKNHDPETKTAALFGGTFTKAISDQLILNRATAVGASAVALHHSLVRAALVQKAKDAGFGVAVWTVDDPRWIERARSMGVDALITNNPAAMLSHR